MRFIPFVAKRFIRVKRREFFRSLTTVFSISGITIGVATLVVVLSVMNGMEDDLRNKILGASGHIIVTKFYGETIDNPDWVVDTLKKVTSAIVGYTPFIYTKILIKHNNATDGVILRGVDPKTFKEVNIIPKKIISGKFELGENGVVLGNYLADGLGAHIGDTIEISSPYSGIKTPFGLIPSRKECIVRGIFDAGMYEINATIAIVSLNTARNLLHIKGVTGIEFNIKNIYKAQQLSKEFILTLGYPYRVRNWINMNKNLFAALKLEKVTMFIILTLIVLVAAFNITSILIMIVSEKTREIGILKALGATGKKIMGIFLLDGIFVGGFGTSLGLSIGYALCWALGKYKFISLPSDVYFIDKLPVHMQISDFIIVGISAFLLSFIATIYPARRASKLDPVEAIRNE
ncbi:ABC transporter permease [candidate division WOR-3 bacterium]|nr:ABC transporter permease [candidate division WOR-3 bacterium]